MFVCLPGSQSRKSIVEYEGSSRVGGHAPESATACAEPNRVGGISWGSLKSLGISPDRDGEKIATFSFSVEPAEWIPANFCSRGHFLQNLKLWSFGIPKLEVLKFWNAKKLSFEVRGLQKSKIWTSGSPKLEV